jgi:hypothetical protein
VATPSPSKAPELEAAAFSLWGKGETLISYLTATGAHTGTPPGKSAGVGMVIGTNQLAGRFHGSGSGFRARRCGLGFGAHHVWAWAVFWMGYKNGLGTL